MAKTDTQAARRPGRPAQGHTGRQRKLHCDACGFLCYASAKAIRTHGAPSCACGAGPLAIAHGRDAVKVSREAVLALALDREAKREEREAEEYAAWAKREERRARREVEQRERGPGAFQCRSCGRFRSRPSEECHYCGDAEGTYGPDLERIARETDRAYGYAA